MAFLSKKPNKTKELCEVCLKNSGYYLVDEEKLYCANCLKIKINIDNYLKNLALK